MGTAALTYDDRARPSSLGHKNLIIAPVTLAASYATGGDDIPTGDRKGGMATLERAWIMNQPDGDFKYELDSQTDPTKILARVPSTGAEVANATNLSAVAGCLIAFQGR